MTSSSHKIPDISLITVTYNASETLISCLESVSSQTLIPEHLIIDGRSTDSTLHIARTYSGHSLHIHSETDKGMYDAMNKGIRISSGEIIGILNADDLYPYPQILEMVSNIFKNPNIDACYGDLLYVNRTNLNKVIRYWRAGSLNSNSFLWGWMPPHPTFFVRRSIYERYGQFNLELGSAADYELMLRLMFKQKINTDYIPEILIKMRTGGVSNLSLQNRIAAHKMDRKAWAVNGLKPYPWTLWLKPFRKLGQWINRPCK